jgi:hypothetical protein
MLSRMRGQVNEGQRVTSKSKGWLAINRDSTHHGVLSANAVINSNLVPGCSVAAFLI